MRQTRQKRLVLEIVTTRRDHPTADQVFLDARAKDGKISRGTVYRNLSQLTDLGLIRHLYSPVADRYDWRLEPHYHLVCTSCGSVTDADIPYDKGLDANAEQLSGYQITQHCTTFEGICPECQKKQKPEH
ncbi:MAG: transcriptional repressor [Sphaerochaeta sp.]|jgi:Fe2+ or Zn2+ uptake regulation protein|nr:transcriptional repressor [Sphaerochaeta sp.]MCH3919958.1 transcriptional repressor [Sphaerochaeta sp.]MCI2045575.1 transcriptional repressor [Sphaerochaeta sp.]MCI2076861.1 transcriptional repressor [Sphaerochaeta sp.]MCI2097616.1 transcriptional repressor [Sphaerochaeta sp.]